MKTIPQTFQKSGYAFRLIERSAHAAVYEQRFAGARLVAFEVHRVRSRTARRIGANLIPAGEHLANDDEWGLHAWTHTGANALEDARARLATLTAEADSHPTVAAFPGTSAAAGIQATPEQRRAF